MAAKLHRNEKQLRQAALNTAGSASILIKYDLAITDDQPCTEASDCDMTHRHDLACYVIIITPLTYALGSMAYINQIAPAMVVQLEM